MGDRWFLTVTCPVCGYEEEGVYFAPTCGFTTWRCPECRRKVDLCKLTGITKKDASNAALIKAKVDGIRGA
jgi:transposase-like protein